MFPTGRHILFFDRGHVPELQGGDRLGEPGGGIHLDESVASDEAVEEGFDVANPLGIAALGAAGDYRSMLASGPTVDATAVTTSSRMASRGGFVTCANSCLK